MQALLDWVEKTPTCHECVQETPFRIPNAKEL